MVILSVIVILVTVGYLVTLNVLARAIVPMAHVIAVLMAGEDLHVRQKDVQDGIKTALGMAHV